MGSVVTDEGPKQEIMSSIAQTIGALTKRKTISRVPDHNGVSLLYIMLEIHHFGREPSIWKDKNIALSSKIRLM